VVFLKFSLNIRKGMTYRASAASALSHGDSQVTTKPRGCRDPKPGLGSLSSPSPGNP
jgi:hypothetical protein